MFLIVTGGEPPGRGLITDLAVKATCVVAADRGAVYCREAGITPRVVVGDMDSLDAGVVEAMEASGSEVLRFSADKDRTDTEIALDEAIRRGAERVVILGALGGRIDHALANVHLLLKALRRGVPARIMTENQEVFLVDGEAVIEDRLGSTVSFLPLTERVEGLCLKGFQYELEGTSMEIGRPYGVSNVIRHPRARVSLETGVLLAVVTTA